MSDLMQGSSGYAIGQIDTAATLINDISSRAAEHINGPAAAVIQVEQTLGSALTLRGTQTDLSARLAVAMGADGRIALSSSTGLNGILTVPNGGSGLGTVTQNMVLLGNGVSTLVPSAGLLFHGPSSVGSGSTLSHEGTITISGNQALSGVHLYTSFTLNSGITITPAAQTFALVLVATTTITINGTINAASIGVPGQAAGTTNAVGLDATDQPGGNGGNGNLGAGASVGGAAGRATVNGVVVASAGTQVTNNALRMLFNPTLAMGGAGGGSGGTATGTGGGTGGIGGGSIVLIAPQVTLGSTAVFITSGGNGGNGTTNGSGGGGGGGAGNVYIVTHSFTDNGATFTQTGGAGGTFQATGSNGSAGRAGVKQILIYA